MEREEREGPVRARETVTRCRSLMLGRDLLVARHEATKLEADHGLHWQSLCAALSLKERAGNTARKKIRIKILNYFPNRILGIYCTFLAHSRLVKYVSYPKYCEPQNTVLYCKLFS